MNIRVVTSLFPSPPRPREGIFALRRWQGMGARGHRVRVIQPVPIAPPLLARGERGEFARMPRRESFEGVAVERPRYLHLPRSPRGNARRFAARAIAALGSSDSGNAERADSSSPSSDRPDVVVCDYAWPAAACAPALAARGWTCVVNGRGSDVLQVAGEARLAPLLAQALRTAGNWTAVSQDLVTAMDRLAGSPGRGVLVPNGVDTARFRPGDRGAAREELGLDPAAPLVLVVGHLIPRKDPLLALAAFHRGAPAGARAVFIGRGPLEAELRAAVEAAGLGDRVSLLGEAQPEELSTWYRAADALLLTSHREGRPNVVLEALASELPVVATDVGGTGELLAGLPQCLVPDDDLDRIASGLAGVLADPPSGERLRAPLASLSWDASLSALEAALENAEGPAHRQP